MKFTKYITGALWTGAFLLVALLVFGALWLVLGALGDEVLATVMQGITLGLVVLWGLDFVTLVVLLALAITAKEKSSTEQDVEF